jgi:hypothetical protein
LRIQYQHSAGRGRVPGEAQLVPDLVELLIVERAKLASVRAASHQPSCAVIWSSRTEPRLPRKLEAILSFAAPRQVDHPLQDNLFQIRATKRGEVRSPLLLARSSDGIIPATGHVCPWYEMSPKKQRARLEALQAISFDESATELAI